MPPNVSACVLMLNRDLEPSGNCVLEWRDVTPTRVLACETLTGPDLKAFNTFDAADTSGSARARAAGRRGRG